MQSNKNMKALLTLSLALTVSVFAVAQNVEIEEQYLQNGFIGNPALTGLENYFDVQASYRNQWAGIEGSPLTYYITGNTAFTKATNTSYQGSSLPLRTSRPDMVDRGLASIGSENEDVANADRHGIGAMVVVDEVGPFQTIMFYGNYAYHFAVTEKAKLSFGANLGINSTSFNRDKASTNFGVTDPTFNDFIRSNEANEFIDGSLGAALYTRKMYVGYSVSRFLGNNGEINQFRTPGFYAAHNLYGAFEAVLNDYFSVIPGMRVHYDQFSPIFADVNAKVNFNDKLFAGITYRYDYALIGLLAFHIDNRLKIGYTYDFNTNNLNNRVASSHELTLSIRVSKNNTRQRHFWH
jgi:type IX secretion system PorP/SprF family membrane protein